MSSSVIRGTSLLRHGLFLALPALLALSVLSASPASATTRSSHPSAPRHVTAMAGDNSAVVSFVAPSSNGGSRITEYFITVHPGGSAIRRCSSTRCSILGLSNGVGYYFTVAAVNRFGRSIYSTPSNPVVPKAPASTPPPASTKTATVTFDANGGTGTMTSETEILNVSAAVTTNTFTRTGYTFTGWNTTANGSGTSFTNGELVEFTYSATFFAQWSATSVIVPSEGQNANWSGYILPTTSLDTEATGEWTVPTLNCADTPNGSSSTWIGTGGNTWSNGTSSGALLQTGVEDDCVNGVQQDSGWWEIVPATPNNEQTFSNFPVSPGDSILAEVYQATSGRWVTIVQDLTTGRQGVMETGDSWYVTTIANSTLIGGIQGDAIGYSYSGAYSVEWIEEVVTSADSGLLYALPNYGSVTFFNLKTSILSGWSLSANDANEIVGRNGAVLSVPGAVVNDGFTVTYTGP